MQAPVLPVNRFRSEQESLLNLCRSLVEIESPTTHKHAVDRVGAAVGAHCEALGASVTQHTSQDTGDHWEASWGHGDDGILMLTHLDTVHELGALERNPWRLEGSRAFGPGALDMKASIALALTVMRVLQEEASLPPRPITLLCTADEETGSESSRALIEERAAQHALVLCLEPGLPGGALKTFRKGIGVFSLNVTGRPAHAGVEPEQGINAVLEMANQILALERLADLEAGTTINVGVIKGGSRSNVVPEHCQAEVDIRVKTEAERRRIDASLSALATVLSGAELELSGGWNRPPLERNARMMQTFEQARSLAARIGLDLKEGGTGGGSDANLVAPLGVPVLDGLGPIGAGAHTDEEYIELDSLAERAALLAALLTGWPAGPQEQA